MKTVLISAFDIILEVTDNQFILFSILLLNQKSDNKNTILEILNDAVFSHKATFNTFFKKQAGMTPLEFKHTLTEKKQDAKT